MTDRPEQWPSLNDLAATINDINRANGWNVVRRSEWETTRGPTDDGVYHIGTILALIHSEVSEALEALRHNDRENFAEELADVLIRVLDCAGGLGIDIDHEVAEKLARNRERGYKHGGKAV